MTENERDIKCLREAEDYCHAQAAMAWSDRERDLWYRRAQLNREQREIREKDH